MYSIPVSLFSFLHIQPSFICVKDFLNRLYKSFRVSFAECGIVSVNRGVLPTFSNQGMVLYVVIGSNPIHSFISTYSALSIITNVFVG